MTYEHNTRLTDEERRDVLQALGVAGAVAVGGASIDELGRAVSSDASEELAPIGQAIAEDTAGELDADMLATQGSAVVERTQHLSGAADRGLPTAEPREEFAAVAEAGRPAYDHLAEIGFFESTTNHLPEFTPTYLRDSVRTVLGADALTDSLADLGFTDAAAADVVATVVANAEQISDHHWVATDEVPREQVEMGEYIPPMTKAAMGGVLLWLEDVDQHLWTHERLLTEDLLSNAVWDAGAMAAGFHLVTEGARRIGEASSELSDAELGALLSTGFAVQAIAQHQLPRDVYWITDEARASPTH